ncbi:phage antirepressor KilAC domain-containing protein [Acinetobacter sp. YH12029]|uniref:phage antirepressor KilAC domain-containing protein n=1 Tax=Acinetobacter sp. YH12029 TaxID=2601044 RepID=UPI0015D28572|nr:phage antirepressor KilAC domain-containing protein [Acinetobacter sp. YH12029]
MNMPILTQFGNSEQKTMSTRVIAELCEKQPQHVKRDCENMFTSLNLDASKFGHIYFDSMNRQQTEYLLDEELTMTLVTGYNIVLRNRVIKRWKELESRELSKMEILQMALESEQQKLVLQQQLEIQAPKVAFVDKYVAGNGNKTFRQVAKLLRIKEYKFREFLELNRIMYKLNGEWTAYQNHVDAKRFHIKTGVSNSGHAFNHALFTPKGIEWIAGELAKFNLRGVA